MKKKISKMSAIICTICIVGFVIGYIGHKEQYNHANAENADTHSDEKKIDNYADVFSENFYDCYEEKDVGGVNIVKKQNAAMSMSYDFYSKEDVDELIYEMLGDTYEYRITMETDHNLVYSEFQNGYPTGGRASFVFDEAGYITEAHFREGELYNFDESTMMTKEEAFLLAIEAIRDKYGEDTIIDGEADDYEFAYAYNGKAQDMCYKIKEVVGHIPDKIEANIDPVYFTITISGDGSYIVVASSLTY